MPVNRKAACTSHTAFSSWGKQRLTADRFIRRLSHDRLPKKAKFQEGKQFVRNLDNEGFHAHMAMVEKMLDHYLMTGAMPTTS